MRRLFATSSVLALLGLPALAGGMAEPVMEPEVVAAQTSSSAGGIIVPLLLLLVVAAAVAGSSGEDVSASDRRMKTDVTWVGMAKGLPVYRYRYIGSAQRFEGVMAQDVLAAMPDAVVTYANGLMAVDYGRLGIKMKVIH